MHTTQSHADSAGRTRQRLARDRLLSFLLVMTHTQTIGVLALQGAFAEHMAMLQKCGAETVEVRTSDDLWRCAGLVIPGGESTAMSLIAERTGLLDDLYKFVADETRAVWGTCAGLIFLARHVVNGKPDQRVLGGLEVTVHRNAYGRQKDSFSAPIKFPFLGKEPFPAIFIRAPVVTAEKGNIHSENKYVNEAPVEIVSHDGLVVLVRQGRKLGTSFHPELLDDPRFHQYFIELCNS